jgi:hypothetical protein
LYSHLPSKNIYIYKYIKDHNFTCCFVSAWNLVSHTKGWAKIEGVLEQGADENI